MLRYLESLRLARPDDFVNKTFVAYGDFRQIPPVPKVGTRNAIVESSVRSSPDWDKLRCFHLHCCHRQQSDLQYARWIERLGNGAMAPTFVLNDERGYISLNMCTVIAEEEDAVSFAFPALNDPAACSQSRILATTNNVVDDFNNRILQKLTHLLCSLQ